jgi:hypothetical protein
VQHLLTHSTLDTIYQIALTINHPNAFHALYLQQPEKKKVEGQNASLFCHVIENKSFFDYKRHVYV